MYKFWSISCFIFACRIKKERKKEKPTRLVDLQTGRQSAEWGGDAELGVG